MASDPRSPSGSEIARAIAKRAIPLAIAGIGLYVVFPSLVQTFSSFPELTRVHPAWFVVMVVLEIGAFACMWALLRLALRRRGWFRIATTQLASNAVSRILPGGAATGGALQYAWLVRSGLDGTVVASALTAVSLASTATVLALPLLALPALLGRAPIDAGLERAAWLGLAAFVLLAVLGAVLLMTNRPLAWIGRAVQSAVNLVRRRRPPITGLGDRLLAERDEIRSVFGHRWALALSTTLGNRLLDYLALLAALLGTGAHPRPSLVLLAYAGSVVLGMIPITPGGLGFVEAGLTAMLTLAGIPAAQATVATLAYRLVSYWLPLAAGGVAWPMFRRAYPVAAGAVAPDAVGPDAIGPDEIGPDAIGPVEEDRPGNAPGRC
ncbi:MAG TPA: YbhN family protein [Actinomycetota bacterium]